jgi:hypothetical protein
MIPEVFDIDGDGQVDEWEFKMADIFRQMTKEQIDDMDGDGDVDEEDLKVTFNDFSAEHMHPHHSTPHTAQHTHTHACSHTPNQSTLHA